MYVSDEALLITKESLGGLRQQTTLSKVIYQSDLGKEWSKWITRTSQCLCARELTPPQKQKMHTERIPMLH